MTTPAPPPIRLEGLDQVSLRLPRSFAGAGPIAIAVNVDGWDANKVTINIR